MKKILFTLLLIIFANLSFAESHMQADSFAVVLKVPAEEVEKMESLIDSHHDFMHRDHSLSGENRLNSYSVVKGFEYKDPTDPSKGLTGNVYYFLSEPYQTPMGLQMHMEAGENWDGLAEMQSMMFQYGLAIAWPGEVIAKMNR